MISKKVPMRRCVGCMTSKPKKDLLRIVLDKDDNLIVDSTGKAAGRGVYICRNSDCLKQARKKKSVSRSLGISISPEKVEQLFTEIQSYEKK